MFVQRPVVFLSACIVVLLGGVSPRRSFAEEAPRGGPAIADDDAHRATATAAIEAARARLHLPGCSVAVIAEGRLAWAQGFGVQRCDGDAPVTPDTLFQAASISKPVAASAALRLVEQGALALDRPVNDLLTSWQVPDSAVANASGVTLRRLLCHGAGLSVHGFAGYFSDDEVPLLEDVLDGAKPANSPAVVIELVPGKRVQYSGGGYCVVQQLLEDATGESFPALMRRLVLDPLGMKESSYVQPLPAARRAQAATGHRERPVRALQGTGFVTHPEMAAAGLWTTPSDLCRFALALQESLAGRRADFLKPDTVREMLKPQVGAENGLGLFLEGAGEVDGEAARFGHGGSNQGFRCQLLAYRNHGLGVAVMTNSDGGDALCGEVLRIIAKEYGWPAYPAN